MVLWGEDCYWGGGGGGAVASMSQFHPTNSYPLLGSPKNLFLGIRMFFILRCISSSSKIKKFLLRTRA